MVALSDIYLIRIELLGFYDFRLSILWTIYDFKLSIFWTIYGSILDHKSLWFQADHTLDHIWFQADHSKIIVRKFVWFVWCHNMVRLWSAWSGNPGFYEILSWEPCEWPNLKSQRTSKKLGLKKRRTYYTLLLIRGVICFQKGNGCKAKLIAKKQKLRFICDLTTFREPADKVQQAETEDKNSLSNERKKSHVSCRSVF